LFENGQGISTLKAIKVMFIFNHPFLNSFLVNSIQPSKLTRLGLFYFRMMIMLLSISIIGPQSSILFGDRRVLNSISLSLDVYLFLIPYITFVPLEAIVKHMLALDHTKKDPSRKKLIKCLKITRGFAIFLAFAIICCCIYGVIAIGEGSTTEENIELLTMLGEAIA